MSGHDDQPRRRPPHPPPPTTASSSSEKAHRDRLERLREARRQKAARHLQQRKAQYLSEYSLPLNYPARVEAVDESNDDDHVGRRRHFEQPPKQKGVRTSDEFVNVRLLEAGLPLGGGSRGRESTLGDHAARIARFVRDMEGTGCYDSVQVFLGNDEEDGHREGERSRRSDSDSGGDRDRDRDRDAPIDVTVRLKEKNWYKLHVGGGVHSDDLSSAGAGGAFHPAMSSSFSAAAGPLLPKLQFETSASLLNLTGFADVTSASYAVDQTGTSSFRFAHDRPLFSCVPPSSPLRQWILPRDPRTIPPSQRSPSPAPDPHALLLSADDAPTGKSHAHLGIHLSSLSSSRESIRSSREFARTLGIRLANHSLGHTGAFLPAGSPPETMAGPYRFVEWTASLRDSLPKRHVRFPFGLDCSTEVANMAGTCLKHSVAGGVFWNGCRTDDRCDPTMGWDAHVWGEVATPPGDVGFGKVKAGGAWHVPWEVVRLMTLGVGEKDYERMALEETRREKNDEENEDEEHPVVMGMTLHSSFQFGMIRPLTFGGLCRGTIPLEDRFYVGGPGQLRGFLPAGIGPRASPGGSSVPGGDALGGDLFYTSTLATSVPFPKTLSALRHNGARLFGFVNAGTCVSTTDGASGTVSLLGWSAWNQILRSSRVSVGGGVSVGSPMGRFEATYAVPVRYGPRDARKAVQFGFGYSFG